MRTLRMTAFSMATGEPVEDLQTVRSYECDQVTEATYWRCLRPDTIGAGPEGRGVVEVFTSTGYLVVDACEFGLYVKVTESD